MKYRKKQVVDAIQFNGYERFGGREPYLTEEVARFIEKGCCASHGAGDVLWLNKRDYSVMVTIGDWILKGEDGELFPCSDKDFKVTYEPVEAS